MNVTEHSELATEGNFNEEAYLLANPDIANAVSKGRISSGRSHFLRWGKSESRRQLTKLSAQMVADRRYLNPKDPLSRRASHSNLAKLVVEVGNKNGHSVLELGSREVTGKSIIRNSLDRAEYTGFDYYPGPNVDVVGDAHKLSGYFDRKFDLIFSSAVFEHLAMPWVVATEIAKLLKVGGHLLVETHFSFSAHERPWNFFQFSDMGLRALFSPALGFECIEAGMYNPIVGRFSSLADEYLRNRRVTGLYCHSEYFGVKTRDVPDFSWEKLNLAEVVGPTKYPSPK